jgi:hypothetical protein
MQNHPQLGERRSVHRASLAWLWLVVLCVVPVLIVTAAATVYAVTSTTSGPFLCLGGSGLLLAILSAMCISDFRQWSATRTARLVIYEQGFTFENKGHMESCGWSDIERIDFRPIEVKSKHSSPRKVSVIRSIVKRDGTVIGLPQTLNLEKITNLIKAAT